MNVISGDMDTIMASIMVVRYDEEDRIRDIINELISEKEVKKFKAFTQVWNYSKLESVWLFSVHYRKIVKVDQLDFNSDFVRKPDI